MNVALDSSERRADGISLTWSRNPGLVEDTLRLSCKSALASHRFDTAKFSQIDRNLIDYTSVTFLCMESSLT